RRATWPFDADDAAQHHLIDEGWVWMLRLENGITSVGATSANHSVSADQLASLLESRFASCEGLSLILRGAKIAEYPGRIFRVPGIQRLFHPVVNQRCVMLPTAACTLDPLHSTGIAHALSGAIRIGEWFEQGCQKEALRDYGDCVVSEALHLDRMVSLAYRAMKGSFPLFAASCMVYFAAAIACEEGLIGGDYPRGYWLSDDADFREAVLQCERSLDLSAIPGLTEEQRIERVQSVLAPWNSAGLFESASNRYAYTATKVS
ncbi:MAG: tryptophan 7-halogenase, partial [Planctomycetota bacterium]